MLKILLKNKLSRFLYIYLYNKKTGKRRSTLSIIGTVFVFALIFFSLGISFFGMTLMLCDALVLNSLDWLYFAFVGILSVMFGIFGSVFNAYNELFEANDNDLLVSMPIKPKHILISRLFSIILTNILFVAVVWIPGVINYWVIKPVNVLKIIYPVLLLPLISLFVSVFSCLLGWIIALISSRLKNKNVITVILSLAIFGVYYFFCFKINDLLSSIIINSNRLGDVISSWLYPVYQLGRAASGSSSGFLVFALIVIALFAVCVFILSKTFVKIVTANKGQKRAKKRTVENKVNSAQKTLYIRELKRFLSSPVYMLNTGFGLVIMLILPVLAIIKRDTLKQLYEILSITIPDGEKFIPILLLAICFAICSTAYISAPSISLEGKNLWIIRSLPVNSKQVLLAKERMHISICILPALAFAIGVGLILLKDSSLIVQIAVLVLMYVYIMADVGLMSNLIKYDFDWANEAVPVKQSMNVAIVLFGGIIFAILIAAAGFFAVKYISTESFLSACIIVLFAIYYLVHKWVFGKGAKIFDTLS